MKTHSLLAGVMLLFTLTAEGQQQRSKIVAEGGTPDDRASARVLYWNTQPMPLPGSSPSTMAGPYGKRNTKTPPSSTP